MNFDKLISNMSIFRAPHVESHFYLGLLEKPWPLQPRGRKGSCHCEDGHRCFEWIMFDLFLRLNRFPKNFSQCSSILSYFIHFQYCRTVVLSFLFHGDPVQWVYHNMAQYFDYIILYIYTHLMMYSHTIRKLYKINHYSYSITYIYIYNNTDTHSNNY